MKIFFIMLVFIIISLAIAGLSFYMSLFFVWGGAISVSGGLTISILIFISILFSLIKFFLKKEDSYQIALSTFILFFLLSIPYYLLIGKDNSKFYKYEEVPCKNEIFSSDYNLTVVTYAGTSMDGFDSITPYNLEDNYYYNMVKENIGHTLIKTYPIGSKWTVKGLYHHTRNRVSYFLLKSIEDNTEAWIYIRNFNFKKCRIDFYYYKDRGVEFETYDIKEDIKREEIIFSN